MALGPFITYVPPNVYTRTLTEANVSNLVAGLRIPVYIGVGQEELEQTNLELVRGSSATLDQQIISEDVTQQFIVDETNPNNPQLGATDGTLTKFRVRNYPIVDGQGFGRVSNNIRSVSVTVNGTPVAVGSVQGAKGYVILQIPPQATDDVRCTYFFHRSDTAFTDDVSDQTTASTAILTTPATAPFVIVAGTTDTFILKVDGVQSTIVFVANSYTALAMKSAIDIAAISGLVTSVFTDNEGLDHVRLSSAKSLEIGTGNANGALGFAPSTATSRNRDFRVFQRPIVDGTDGGITTTDPSKVTVLVDNVQVIAEAVDGTNGVVTLPYAPAMGSTVVISYFANTWQDTFDYLPNTLVTQVLRAGFAPLRNDYIEQQDFVVSNPSTDVSIIHWGSSFVVASATRSSGADLFDSTQIIPTLVDDRIFLAECDRLINTTVVPAIASPNQFTLPEVPTTGNGRDTPLGSAVFNAVTNNRMGLNTNRPDLVQVWAGHDIADALSRPKLTVRTVDSTTRIITLKEDVPPNHNLYATFWFSRLRDDIYIFTCKVPGAVGTGQYEVYSTLEAANVMQTRFGAKSSLPETVQWPRGVETIPDAYHAGTGTPVSETVTVTFLAGTAENAVFTNEGAAPYQFYPSTSNLWRMTLNGTPYVTNLNTAVVGYLVGSHVTVSGTDHITITTGTNDELNITVDGADTDVTLTAGSRLPAEIVSDINVAAGGAVRATGTLSLNSNILDTETVTIGSKVYTFLDTLINADGNVHIGATASDTLDNLIAAITLGAGSGTAYAATMTVHPTVMAAAGAGDTMVATAKLAGLAGNSIATTETITDVLSVWSTATLLGGLDGTPVASYVQIGGTGGDVIFVIHGLVAPASLPGGFDHVSGASIRQGTAETTLGFTTFQSASGTPTATNKPATILGTVAGPFNIQAGVNETLEIRVDGIDYTITLPTGSAVATTAVYGAINAVPGLATVGSAGTLANLNKLRLTSTTRNATSNVTILGGNANDVLGLTEGDTASATQVTAQEVVDELLATASFTTDGIAYASTVDGSSYITIESLTTGATASSVAFTSGSASAFNETTGTEIIPGTSGDNGEDASDIFTVTSSNLTAGSSGSGTPGQTYTDARTGLRFTILPSLTGNYNPSGSFTLIVSPTFVVHPARPWLSIGGLEVVVTDTVGVGVNDTATVQTFDPGGLEPAIGDFYFLTYLYQKQDFTTRLFQQFKTIEANFGPLSGENRVTLAAYLAILNGAVLVGIKQVLKVANTNQASDQAFFDAITELATPLPGNVKPDVLVPLATSTGVYQFLLQHCEVQSNIRNQGERMGFIGFASGTSPTTAQTIAKSLQSNRMIAVYPDSAVITLANEVGEQYETLVDGTFLAAALAGAAVSPAVDVATPYTRRTIQGFTRLVRILDPIEANQTAVAGVTILEDLDPIVRVRQGLTTDMTSILTRLPTVTQIADFVQQQSRLLLDAFVGTKFLASRTNEVEVAMTGLFKSLMQAEIVGAFTGISAEVDATDPTILRFEAFYQPIFPLLYLVLTFNLRARI